MGSAGFNVPLLGGDGCQDTKFITDANSGSKTSEAEGSYATSAPDVTKLASSATFFSQYASAYSSKAAPYNDGTKEPYTAYGYDAMNILLQAIHAVLVANGGQPPASPQAFRDAVVAALHNDVVRRCARPHELRRQRRHDQHRVHPLQGDRAATGSGSTPTRWTPAATSR